MTYQDESGMAMYPEAELPESATFYKEEAGVKWYVEENEQGRVLVNYMVFDGKVLPGGWCGSRWVFRALIEMSQEERLELVGLRYDTCIGCIREKIDQFK